MMISSPSTYFYPCHYPSHFTSHNKEVPLQRFVTSTSENLITRRLLNIAMPN